MPRASNTITFHQCVVHNRSGEKRLTIKDVDYIQTDSPLVIFGRGGKICTVVSLEPGEYVTTESETWVDSSLEKK